MLAGFPLRAKIDPVIQHVAIPVPTGLLAACVGFYRILGFEPLPVPASLADRAVWLVHGGQQLHLLVSDAGPGPGHVALHGPRSFAEQCAALGSAGHEVEPRAEHWGAARAYARDPAGNLVELMASPPPAGR